MLSKKGKRKQNEILSGVYVDTSLKVDKFDSRDRLYVPSGSGVIPAVYTISNLPSIENQYSINSCVANAAVGVLEIMLNNNNAFRDLSRLFLYYTLRDGTVYAGRDVGAELRDGFKAVNKLGIVDESDYPYDISKVNQRPSDDIFALAEPHKAFNYERVLFNVNGRDPRSLINIKHAVAEGYPVLFSMLTCANFESLHNNTIDYVYDPNKHVGMHGMVVCGYNDVDNYFYIKNSWGNSWGENGYCKIRYEVFQQILMDAWICKSFDGYGMVVTPPPSDKIIEIASIESTNIVLVDTRFKVIELNKYVNIRTIGNPNITFRWENYLGTTNTAKLTETETNKVLVEVNNTGKYEITCTVFDNAVYAGKVHFYLEYKRSVILTDIKKPVINYTVHTDGLPLEIAISGGVLPYNLSIFKYTKNLVLNEYVGTLVHAEQGLGTIYLPNTNAYPDQGTVHTSATFNIYADEYIKIVVADARYVLKDVNGIDVTLKNCEANTAEVIIEGKHFFEEVIPSDIIPPVEPDVLDTDNNNIKITFWDKVKTTVRNITFNIINAWRKLTYKL